VGLAGAEAAAAEKQASPKPEPKKAEPKAEPKAATSAPDREEESGSAPSGFGAGL